MSRPATLVHDGPFDAQRVAHRLLHLINAIMLVAQLLSMKVKALRISVSGIAFRQRGSLCHRVPIHRSDRIVGEVSSCEAS